MVTKALFNDMCNNLTFHLAYMGRRTGNLTSLGMCRVMNSLKV